MKEKTGMKTITFYSYKGGVGRTLLTANIARILAALGKKVVIADFDFDAPGIPAAFGIRTEDVERGFFELSRSFTCKSTFEDEREFKQHLGSDYKLSDNSMARPDIEKYLLSTPNISLTGKDDAGKIDILPCGKLTREYWHALHERDWMSFLVAPPTERRSFIRLFKDFIQPTLAKSYDYLLIDSRAGITKYGEISRIVADRQAIIFCPNDEAKYALANIIIPDFIEEQSTPNSIMEKVVFVVSRMPPELVDDTASVFNDMQTLICRALPETLRNVTKILRLDSDLDTQLSPQKWNLENVATNKDTSALNLDIISIFIELFDELVKVVEEDFEKKFKNTLPVKRRVDDITNSSAYTDVLLTVSALSDEETKLLNMANIAIDDPAFIDRSRAIKLLEARKAKRCTSHTILDKLLKELLSDEFISYKELDDINMLDGKKRIPAVIWYAIFNTKFEIKHKYRMFIYDILHGALLNPSDMERNISFKVETFRKILNEFYETLEKHSVKQDRKARQDECEDLLQEALSTAGREAGETFGVSFANLLKEKNEFSSFAENAKLWCEFDSDAGFGVMSYDPIAEKIIVKNLFLNDSATSIERKYNAFFEGYSEGVASKLRGKDELYTGEPFSIPVRKRYI